MSDFKINTDSSGIDPKEFARRIALVYQHILFSWDSSNEKEPFVDNRSEQETDSSTEGTSEAISKTRGGSST